MQYCALLEQTKHLAKQRKLNPKAISNCPPDMIAVCDGTTCPRFGFGINSNTLQDNGETDRFILRLERTVALSAH